MATSAPQHPPTPEDQSRNLRRKQLIDATIEAIAEHGLSRITLAKVAGAARMSPGIVNFYFKSKEQLLLETLREMGQEFDHHIRRAIGDDQDPALALEGLIDGFFDPVIFNVDKAAVWSAFWGESQARNDYLKICGDRDAEFYDAIHDCLVRLSKREQCAHLNTHAAARGFEGLLDGYWQELLCAPDAFDVDTARQTCRGYLSNLFPNASPPQRSDPAPDMPAIRTLMAPWTYANAEFFELERERIFKRSWLIAGHVCELQQPGDFITFDGLNERAIVIRGADRQLRAFHNVCRHRGGRLVREDAGHCPRSIVCPFHGWTYNLDGSLKNVPAIKTFAQLDKSAHGLVALDLEVWQGFVFIRFGGDGPSVAEQLAPVEPRLAPYRLEQLTPLGPMEKDPQSVNWKVVHDIDNEGYHVPIGHPGLHALFGKEYMDTVEDGVFCSSGRIQQKPARQWSVARYQNLLPHYEHLPEENQRLWFYFGLFPNAVFELHPESVSYYMTLPEAPDQVTFVSRYFALPDPRPEARAAQYLGARINRQVGFEDQSFVDWVQQGLRSSAYPDPTLSSIEWGVSEFHRRVQEALPAGRLADEPDAGTVSRVNDSLSGQRG